MQFSEWSTLQRAIANLIMTARRSKVTSDSRASQHSKENEDNHGLTLEAIKRATIRIIRTVQEEAFESKINALEKKSDEEPESRKLLKERGKVLRKSDLCRLDPFVDKDRILHVGECIHRADFAFEEKRPIILPRNTRCRSYWFATTIAGFFASSQLLGRRRPQNGV